MHILSVFSVFQFEPHPSLLASVIKGPAWAQYCQLCIYNNCYSKTFFFFCSQKPEGVTQQGWYLITFLQPVTARTNLPIMFGMWALRWAGDDVTHATPQPCRVLGTFANTLPIPSSCSRDTVYSCIGRERKIAAVLFCYSQLRDVSLIFQCVVH